MSTPASELEAYTPSDEEKQQPLPVDENRYLVEWDEGNDPLNPKNFHKGRKWFTLIVVCTGATLVTCASSIDASTNGQVTKAFGVSEEVATLGLTLFVIGIAVGPMVVSPLSELYGRKPIYIISIFFFVMFLIPCAAAHNIQTLLVGRFLSGVAGSGFLTVSGGTVSDLFNPSEIQAPMVLYTIAPFFGPILGPVLGGFICQFTSWRWTFYVLIIWTVVVLIGVIIAPETFGPALLARKAAGLRKSTGNNEYHSASELANRSKSLSNMLLHSLYRPFQLLLLEPMCLCLCLYSAILLGIIYLFFGAFPLVFGTNHGFNEWQIGLSFLGLAFGILAGAATNPLWYKNYQRLVTRFHAANPPKPGGKPLKPDPEFRLPPTIVGSVLVPIGLFWFGWTTYSSVHWIVPIIGSGVFMLGAFFAFSGMFTFLVDAYPLYAASAMAANAFTRCMFAAVFPLFGTQMYKGLGYQWATSLLAFLALAMTPFPFLFYKYGKTLRARSRFAAT